MQELISKLRLAIARYARSHCSFRGRSRLLRATDRVLRRLSPARLNTIISGVNFVLDTEDLIDFHILYLGVHQLDLVDYISARLGQSDSVLWDVGANVGSVSLCIASRIPNVIIHAFEPSPPVCARLEENVGRNPGLKPRIHLHREALHCESGMASFYVSNEPFNSGVGGLQRSSNREATPVHVMATRGDDLIESGTIPKPHLIKIDVEGF